MYNWYECKVKYDKTLDTGLIKTVTETYMLDALSFTEAEARIIQEMKPFISGAFAVADIKRKKYAQVHLDHIRDRFYRVRLFYITLDEKTGSEKKTSFNHLVMADDLRGALDKIEQEMKKTMIDYEVHTVTETPILEIFLYEPEKQSK